MWSNIIFLFCCKTWNYWKKFFLKNSNWVKWKQLLCFSKYYMKVLYWFDYTFCESVDSCIEKHFRWCHLMVTLDTFKNHSSIICLVPATSWFGRNYFSEPVRFGWDSILWGDFCFLWTSCLFEELLTSVGCIVTFFFLLHVKMEISSPEPKSKMNKMLFKLMGKNI